MLSNKIKYFVLPLALTAQLGLAGGARAQKQDSEREESIKSCYLAKDYYLKAEENFAAAMGETFDPTPLDKDLSTACQKDPYAAMNRIQKDSLAGLRKCLKKLKILERPPEASPAPQGEKIQL